MNPAWKTAAMMYGAYQTGSLVMGGTSLEQIPGNAITTAGNVAIGGIAVGSSLNYLKTTSPETYNMLRSGFNKLITPGKVSTYASTTGAYGVPYKTTVSSFEYATSKLGMNAKQFANKGFFKSSLEILSKEGGSLGTKVKAVGALAVERGGPLAKSSLEYLMERAPKSLMGAGLAIGGIYLASRFLTSATDSMFGARRRRY